MLDIKDRYLLFDGKEREERRVTSIPDEEENEEQEEEEKYMEDEKDGRRSEDPVKKNSRRVLTNIVDDIMRRFDNNPEKFTRSINVAAKNYYTSLHTERSLLASLRSSFRKTLGDIGKRSHVGGGERMDGVYRKKMRVGKKCLKRTRVDETGYTREVNISEHDYVRQATFS